MGMGDPVTGKPSSREVADSYVVRIYRHGEEPGHEVVGLLEPVDQGEPRAFRGRDELWALLVSSPTARDVPPRRTRDPKRQRNP